MIFANDSREQVARAAAPRAHPERAIVGAGLTGLLVVELSTYLTVSAERKPVLMLAVAVAAVGAYLFGNVLRVEAAVARIGREQRRANDTDVLASLPAKAEIARWRWASLVMTGVASVVATVAAVSSTKDTIDAVLVAVLSLSTTAGSALVGMYSRPRT